AAQRDLLRRIATDHRILHVEVRPPCIRTQQYVVDDALCRKIRLELAVVERLLGEIDRQDVEKVELAVQKSEPARLPFFHDHDFHSTCEGQLAILQCVGNGL